MPLECATTEKVLIQMGTLPAAVLPQQIHETLDAAGDLYELREVSADREHRYMVLTVHISQAEDHIAALKALGWSRVTLGERTGTAAANLSALRQEQTALAEKRALLEEAIIQCAGQKPELRQLSDASRIEIDRGEAKSRTRDTAETFLLEGWATIQICLFVICFIFAVNIRNLWIRNLCTLPPYRKFLHQILSSFTMVRRQLLTVQSFDFPRHLNIC